MDRDKCPHHDGVESTLHDIRTELRAIRSTQDAMMLHLIPQQTRNGGISISAGNTQHGATSQTSGDWSKLWVSILMLVVVVVGGWLASQGFAVPSERPSATQTR